MSEYIALLREMRFVLTGLTEGINLVELTARFLLYHQRAIRRRRALTAQHAHSSGATQHDLP